MVAALISLAACESSSAGPQAGQTTFKTPDEAVMAFVTALATEDHTQLQQICGPGAEDLVNSGDPVQDRENRKEFLRLYDEAHKLEPEGEGMLFLCVGKEDWPFPIPLVKAGDCWYWDTEEGRQELLDRRIGKNELDTMQVLEAIVDAQEEYYRSDPDGDGILEYAQHFRSTSPERKDGLYWPAQPGEPQSPLGELAAEASAMGYDVDRSSREPRPFHGYVYRILKAQGPHAPGGAFTYMAGENMIGGFAVIARPASYGDSGIMTFMVNYDGQIYQKDLGPETAAIADAIQVFDPDETWEKVSPEQVAAPGSSR